jgi:hypothetical protein
MDVFYGNPNLSPTDKAIIVGTLAGQGATADREIFIEGAANAQSIEMGFFYRRQAELIAAYNKKVAKVNGFARLGAAPMLQTSKGTVSVLPVDSLYWLPPLESLIPAPGAARCGSPAAPARERRRNLSHAAGRCSQRPAAGSANNASRHRTGSSSRASCVRVWRSCPIASRRSASRRREDVRHWR